MSNRLSCHYSTVRADVKTKDRRVGFDGLISEIDQKLIGLSSFERTHGEVVGGMTKWNDEEMPLSYGIPVFNGEYRIIPGYYPWFPIFTAEGTV